MTWGIYELVAQQDAAALRARLAVEGCAVRELDGTGITDGVTLQARAAETFGFEPDDNWDVFADYMWMALVPGEEEGKTSALFWDHADVLAGADMAAFLMAFDVLTSTARAAYENGFDITIFLLGDAPGFPRLP